MFGKTTTAAISVTTAATTIAISSPSTTDVNPNVLQSKKYREHKKDGVFYCKNILENNSWIEDKWGFHNSKKKDDLADCFLQGVWYLQHKNCVKVQPREGLTEQFLIVTA